MHKSFISEYLLCSVANVQIFSQLFTLDFAKTICVLIVQLIITTLVRLIFDYITKKKQKNHV